MRLPRGAGGQGKQSRLPHCFAFHSERDGRPDAARRPCSQGGPPAISLLGSRVAPVVAQVCTILNKASSTEQLRRQGTKNVLAAVSKSLDTIKRVVLTTSFAGDCSAATCAVQPGLV